eukprot:1146330-Pelagomonas_calceolata.AAC.5
MGLWGIKYSRLSWRVLPLLPESKCALQPATCAAAESRAAATVGAPHWLAERQYAGTHLNMASRWGTEIERYVNHPSR